MGRSLTRRPGAMFRAIAKPMVPPALTVTAALNVLPC